MVRSQSWKIGQLPLSAEANGAFQDKGFVVGFLAFQVFRFVLKLKKKKSNLLFTLLFISLFFYFIFYLCFRHT